MTDNCLSKYAHNAYNCIHQSAVDLQRAGKYVVLTSLRKALAEEIQEQRAAVHRTYISQQSTDGLAVQSNK